MDDTFYDGHDELYHRSKFGEDRTTRAGCRCKNTVFVFCFVFFTGRMPRSSKLPVLFLVTGKKIRFFAPQGRLVPPILVKLCSVDGHLGPLGCAKFHVNRCRRVGMRPQKYQKFPLFGRVAPQGRLPWPISTVFRGFYTTNYPTLVFQISYDSHHRLRSYCAETARR